MRRMIWRGALIGVLLGAALAIGFGRWYASERGERRETPFILAAVLSLPLSEAVAVVWPESGTARYSPWFLALVPPLNGLLVGSMIGGFAGALRAAARKRRARSDPHAV